MHRKIFYFRERSPFYPLQAMIPLIYRNLTVVILASMWASSPIIVAETTSQVATDTLPPYSSEQVVDKILEIKKEGDIGAALDFLSEQMDRRADRGRRFGGLYGKIWREAQVKSGRLDADWASRLYDQLFISCQEHRRFGEMNDVMGNLLAVLDTAGRHGRKTEVLEWWAEERSANGKLLETGAYPDLGPAFPFLPEVRKRDIPEEVLYWRAKSKESSPIRKVDLGQKNSLVFDIYASHLGKAGRWQESLEWDLQIHRWASLEDGSPRWQLIQRWFSSVESIADRLQWLGFVEEALSQVDQGLAAPMQESYHGRYNITFSLMRLVLLMELGRAPEDLVEQAKALAERSEQNIHLSVWHHRWAKVVVAKTLLHQGEDTAGLAILDELAEIGFIEARKTRLRYWIDTGMLERIEPELLSLLDAFRESGNKSSESWLYEKYADYLEASGRFEEALAMRREVIRLYKSFNHFTKIPVQLAKLAHLLERMGDSKGSKAAAAEARGLIAENRLPAGRLNLAMGILAKLDAGVAAFETAPEKTVRVDFQPEHSIVIPIEGAAWTTMLTLANPSGKVKEGILSSRGMAMKFSEEGEHGDVVVRPLLAAEHGEATLRLRLEPKTYALIRITADQSDSKEGGLSLVWSSLNERNRVEANLQIEAPEKGVSSSIIQAGNYRANPFYGVPVYLHYVSKDQAKKSFPLRFTTSEKARVEVYAIDSAPLSVDAQGNGSLRDRGDELFGAGDHEGNLQLPLVGGAAPFMVLIYPDGPLHEDGLNLNVEIQQDGDWVLNSQNRLMP